MERIMTMLASGFIVAGGFAGISWGRRPPAKRETMTIAIRQSWVNRLGAAIVIAIASMTISGYDFAGYYGWVAFFAGIVLWALHIIVGLMPSKES